MIMEGKESAPHDEGHRQAGLPPQMPELREQGPTMRRHQVEKHTGSDLVETSILIPHDLLDMVDHSANQNGFSRCCEMSRLIVIAFEKSTSEQANTTSEITGHVV